MEAAKGDIGDTKALVRGDPGALGENKKVDVAQEMQAGHQRQVHRNLRPLLPRSTQTSKDYSGARNNCCRLLQTKARKKLSV
jgi:hypothetical protein